MPIDEQAPADTSMMRIVHTALRRDLERARVALTGDNPPDARQTTAIARHLIWMMHFLEAHHRSEDDGLYPLVRTRRPDAAAVLDAMDDDHRAVAPAIEHLESAATAASAGSGELDPLIAAIDRLSDVLVPHLRREEDEAMPIVTECMTHGEWHAIEQRYNLDGKSSADLGIEGHWLIDDATPDDRATVLGLVGPVTRFALLYGFGPVYRRRARACWQPPRGRVQHAGSTSVIVDASVDAVWDIIRDPTRVGEWSHECVAAEWVGAETTPRAGARFRGRNKQGVFRWGRVCEIVSAEPTELVWRTVPTTLYPDSTEWAIRAVTADGATRIEQSFRVVKGTWLEAAYARLLPAHRDRTAALTNDLERIGALALRRPVDHR